MDTIKDFIELSRRSGKKIVVVNANCHGTALVKFLKSSKSFTELFEIYPLPAIQENTEKRINNAILSEADVFIHQYIRENNSVAYELSDQVTVRQLKKSCLNLVIPNLVGLGKWLYPNLGEIILDDTKQKNLIFRDDILDEAVRNNVCSDISFYIDFFNKYEYSTKILDDLYEQNMMKLKERQKKWNVNIYDFVINNYKSIPMYVDAGHPSKYVMYEIGRKTLESLSIKNDVLLEDYDSSLGLPAPAAPRIKKFFGIDYTLALEPRRSLVFNSVEAIDEEQYIYEYITEYLYLVHNMKLF